MLQVGQVVMRLGGLAINDVIYLYIGEHSACGVIRIQIFIACAPLA